MQASTHKLDGNSHESDSDSEGQKNDSPTVVRQMEEKFHDLKAKCDSEESRLRNLRRLTASLELEIDELQTRLGDLQFEARPATRVNPAVELQRKSRMVRSIPRSKVYHIAGCQFFENPRGIDFTEDVAQQLGLTICANCAKRVAVIGPKLIKA